MRGIEKKKKKKNKKIKKNKELPNLGQFTPRSTTHLVAKMGRGRPFKCNTEKGEDRNVGNVQRGRGMERGWSRQWRRKGYRDSSSTCQSDIDESLSAAAIAIEATAHHLSKSIPTG